MKPIEDLPGTNIITSYWYDDVLSGSPDQPYSISQPYYSSDSPVYNNFFHYDAKGNQDASWYYWDDVSNNVPVAGYDKCIITLNNLDDLGRNVLTRRVVQILSNEPNPAVPDIEALLAGSDGIILSETGYNSIGKVYYTLDEFDNMTVYDYDRAGLLVQTLLYQYNRSNPEQSILLSTSRTLYNVEGRVKVSVGPYVDGGKQTTVIV